MNMIRMPIYSLSAGIVYVKTTRVNKHRYKKDSISAKLFGYWEERWATKSTSFSIVNETNARMLANYFP